MVDDTRADPARAIRRAWPRCDPPPCRPAGSLASGCAQTTRFSTTANPTIERRALANVARATRYVFQDAGTSAATGLAWPPVP